MSLRSSRYLVTTSVEGRSWHTVWDPHHDLALDHPAIWTLAETKAGLQLKRDPEFKGDSATLEIPFDQSLEGVEFTLPPVDVKAGTRSVHVRVMRVPPIPPAYLPLDAKHQVAQRYRQTDIFVYTGIGDFMLNCRRVRSLYGSLLDGHRVFAFYKSGDGYKIKSYRDEVMIESPNGDFRPLMRGVPEFIDARTMEQGTLRYGNRWWRINQVDVPEELPRILFENENLSDSRFFKRAFRSIGFMLALLFVFAQTMTRTIYREKKQAPPQTVTLKQPKILPMAKATPTPRPTPEPKKVAEKPKEAKPKASLQPPPKPKKIAREKPKPVKVAKAPTPPAAKPKASLQPPPKKAPAQAAPKKAAAPPVVAPPNPSVVAQQQLAKSLSFLSSPSKSRAAAPVVDNSAHKYKDAVAVANVSDLKAKNALRGISSARDSSDLQTKGSRNINADGGISGSPRGKGLNEVRGKVSLDALYDPNAGAEMGSSLGGGKGLSISGPGNIPDGLIEKVLSKYLSKFQYCYEKALLQDASLAGTVVVQWTIEPSGRVADVKVVRSQIPNKSMQNCLAGEIAKIPNFPKPSGGPATIKYPFAFSSSSL